MKKIILAVVIFFMFFCTVTYANSNFITVGRDDENNEYIVVPESIKINKFYVSFEYIIVPGNQDLLNELIAISNKPEAFVSTYTVVCSKDFKYHQCIEYCIIDYDFNILFQKKFPYNKNDYTKIKKGSIGADMAELVENIITGKHKI